MNFDKQQHILIAEDDTNFGMMLQYFLQMNGFVVTLCANGELAIQAFRQADFDLCILDVMMPLMDGFTVADTITKARKEIPFVFLTAKSLKEDQIKGYKSGASDYLIKPFDPEILLLKMKVLLHKNGKINVDNSVYQIGNYVFNYEKRLLQLSEQQFKLSPKESGLLKLLCDRKDELLSHEEALLKIWKNDDYFTKQSMNVFITRLRKYLDNDPGYHIEIENLHGKGFIFKFNKKE